MSRIFGENLKKKHMIYFSYCPVLDFLSLKLCNCDIPESDILLKLHVCITHRNIVDVYFFSELCPLIKLRPFEKIGMKFCKCQISKRTKARNLKLASDDRGL